MNTRIITACLSLIFVLKTNAQISKETAFIGYATAKMDTSISSLSVTGWRNSTEKYTLQTIQPVGSVSKVIIGLSVAKAVELNLVNLDSNISIYLGYPVVNPHLSGNSSITLRQLCNHTSSIIDRPSFYKKSYVHDSIATTTLEEFLKSYLKKGQKEYSSKNFSKNLPGESFNYSNIGSALAALIVEKASGMPFHVFTELYIFKPLSLKHTSWFVSSNPINERSTLYSDKNKALKTYSLITYPDGGLKTSPEDLTIILQTLMKGYAGEHVLMNVESWQLFYQPSLTASTKNINPREPNCGLFIFYRANGDIGHTGSDPGVSAMIYFEPKTLSGKLFMANKDLSEKNIDAFKTIWNAY